MRPAVRVGKLIVTRLGRGCALVCYPAADIYQARVYAKAQVVWEGKWDYSMHTYWKNALVTWLNVHVYGTNRATRRKIAHAVRKAKKKTSHNPATSVSA